MKMFNDSHLEVKKFFKGTFFTHPYEAMKCLMELGWVRLSAGRLWMNME